MCEALGVSPSIAQKKKKKKKKEKKILHMQRPLGK
jgi:hypothetical protein